jgi:hypothetical protein
MAKKELVKWDGRFDAENGVPRNETITLFDGCDYDFDGYHQLEIDDPRGESFVKVQWRNVGDQNKDNSIQFMIEETRSKKTRNVKVIYFNIPLKMAGAFIESLSKVAPDPSKK